MARHTFKKSTAPPTQGKCDCLLWAAYRPQPGAGLELAPSELVAWNNWGNAETPQISIHGLQQR